VHGLEYVGREACKLYNMYHVSCGAEKLCTVQYDKCSSVRMSASASVSAR
jgi:hypothetical protein